MNLCHDKGQTYFKVKSKVTNFFSHDKMNNLTDT